MVNFSDRRAVHTAYVFPSLELRRAEFDTDAPGDYTLDSSTEVAYLFANGVRLARLVHQPLDSAGDGHLLRVFFELGDHLGSTSVALDKDTGELVERSTYQAYGGAESSYRPSKWGDFREDYRFTGKEEDVEVGLTYFGKRFYNALLQRWVSPDPLEVHQPGQADANLYAYVRGAALKNVDPLGLADDEAPAPEFSMADDIQVNQALDNAFDPCANDGCVKLDTAPNSPPPARAEAHDAPKPGDDSICPGVCHDNPNLTSDEYRKALGGATAETLAGSLPYVGEAMDIETLLNSDSSLGDKGWAAAGLALPFVAGKTLQRVFGSGGDDIAGAVANGPTPRSNGSVLLDSNVTTGLRADPTLGGRVLPGEQPMKSYVTIPEMRNAVTHGNLRGVPGAAYELPTLTAKPSLDTRINIRGMLPDRPGRFGDGIIGGQALESNMPLVTNDKALKAAVEALGGTTR